MAFETQMGREIVRDALAVEKPVFIRVGIHVLQK